MPILLLNKKAIDAIPPAPKGQVLYRDSQLTGFGLRVGTSAKVWFAEGQVDQRTRRVTIGRADLLHPDIARKKAMMILSEMMDGVDPNKVRREQRAERITMDEAFDAFFAAKAKLAPSTTDAYRRTQRLYLAGWKGKTLQKISRQMVLGEHRRITEAHGQATANSVFRHFRSVYNFTAANYEAFPPNPALILGQARAWHKERRRKRLITVSQLPVWWQTLQCQSRDARDIMTLALFTGMRRSEILSLQWDFIDFAGGALHLPHTKNGDPLDLPMSDVVADVIAARRELAGQSCWVFPGSGKTGHLTEVKTYVARMVNASGIEFSMHDLRRTFITIAESLDIPAYALKRLLNHRTDGDVTGGYIVFNAERLREPANRVASRITQVVEVCQQVNNG